MLEKRHRVASAGAGHLAEAAQRECPLVADELDGGAPERVEDIGRVLDTGAHSDELTRGAEEGEDRLREPSLSRERWDRRRRGAGCAKAVEEIICPRAHRRPEVGLMASPCQPAPPALDATAGGESVEERVEVRLPERDRVAAAVRPGAAHTSRGERRGNDLVGPEARRERVFAVQPFDCAQQETRGSDVLRCRRAARARPR